MSGLEIAILVTGGVTGAASGGAFILNLWKNHVLSKKIKMKIVVAAN